MTAVSPAPSRRRVDPSPQPAGATARSARAAGATARSAAGRPLSDSLLNRPLARPEPSPSAPTGPRRRRLATAGGVLVALATVFGLVLVHVQLTSNQVRLTRLQNQADAAQERYLRLRLEMGALESPARVTAAARQLGMVPPATITYLTAVPVPTGPGWGARPGGAEAEGTGPGRAGLAPSGTDATTGPRGADAASAPVGPGADAAAPGGISGWASVKRAGSRR